MEVQRSAQEEDGMQLPVVGLDCAQSTLPFFQGGGGLSGVGGPQGSHPQASPCFYWLWLSELGALLHLHLSASRSEMPTMLQEKFKHLISYQPWHNHYGASPESSKIGLCVLIFQMGKAKLQKAKRVADVGDGGGEATPVGPADPRGPLSVLTSWLHGSPPPATF